MKNIKLIGLVSFMFILHFQYLCCQVFHWEFTDSHKNLTILSDQVKLNSEWPPPSFHPAVFKGDWEHVNRRKEYEAWLSEKQLKDKLQTALADVRKLEGLLPVCARCKKIRDNEGYWQQIEIYLEKHADVEFTHGLCEDCDKELYGDKDWHKKMKSEDEPSD